MPSTACEIATNKAKNWIALVVIGSSTLFVMGLLALIGFGYGLPEVGYFMEVLHETGTLYFIVIAGVILIVMALMKLVTKNRFCVKLD